MRINEYPNRSIYNQLSVRIFISTVKFSYFLYLHLYEIIAELNRIGMIIDLTHSSTHTAKDVLLKSEAPVIFSHSAVRAICDLTVNIPDDVIRSLARTEE
ncbi:Dipeptidase 3 [Armadillidium vulgare]|nr:Dipeptidase 3 [Armadillidium vulgare]